MKIGIIVTEISFKVEDDNRIRMILIRVSNNITSVIGSVIMLDNKIENLLLNRVMVTKVIIIVVIKKRGRGLGYNISNRVNIEGRSSFIKS